MSDGMELSYVTSTARKCQSVRQVIHSSQRHEVRTELFLYI